MGKRKVPTNPPVPMTSRQGQTLKALRDLLARRYGWEHRFDLAPRELYVTPCHGQYGEVAFVVITVNGSPPRGTIFHQMLYCQSYWTYTHMRKLGAAQSKVVDDFVEAWLADENGMYLDFRVRYIPGDQSGLYTIGPQP
jgi:hypothetical protein